MKRILYPLSGLCAGLAAFAVIELLSAAGFSSYLMLSLSQGAALGLLFGFTFGFAEGIIYKELRSGLIKAVTAGVIGAVTAAAAQLLASRGILWTANLVDLSPLWRGFGWMLTGAAIGIIDGIHQRSPQRIVAGLLGGLLGGLTGGLCFELIVTFLPAVPIAGAAGLMLMGGLIGLFLSEFERRFSFARLKVLNGNLKDREFLLIKTKTVIGENSRDDVYLYGYRKLPSGTIYRTSGEIYFEPSIPEGSDAKQTASNKAGLLGSAAARNMTMLNDRPADKKQPLKYQDVIRLGSVKLLYLPL